jgi:16S rRNA (adenine1518-N6/adenine1519-N6)-dimethyltransferase
MPHIPTVPLMTPKTGTPVRSVTRSKPKKSLGQNFLVDSRVAKKIISAADISSDDTVLEIGPGRGALTRHLAETCKRLVAIELDSELASELLARFSNDPGVEIIHGDARDVSVDQFINAGERYKLLANLPYYAANRIVRRFLTAERKPSILVFMVQREVARTMAAQPGDMGLLSVMIQLYGSVKVAFTVPPRAFRPAPKVTSAVVRIDVYDQPALDLISDEDFFDLIIAGFSAPRKQIKNSLRNGLKVTSEIAGVMLEAAGIDPKRRPETLSVAEWGDVYNQWRTVNP